MTENNEAPQQPQTAQETSQVATANPEGGNTPAPTDRVERAEQLVKRMDEFEKRMDEKIKKLEYLRSESILGGGSEAGQRELTPAESETQKAKAMADEIVKAFKK